MHRERYTKTLFYPQSYFYERKGSFRLKQKYALSRMSFLMCSAGFIMLMLFEENKRSYHLMLQEFINSKGHEALFAVFDHVLGQLPPAESFRGGSDAVPTLPG